jgi:hypothetical protein
VGNGRKSSEKFQERSGWNTASNFHCVPVECTGNAPDPAVHLCSGKEKNYEHEVISRFDYFQKIFKSRAVLLKQNSVLGTELNFDSNGISRFSIKKNHTKQKKMKTRFFYGEK